MIKTADAIGYGRKLLGTPYSTYDCINFIKRIIRKAPGGDPFYTDAHVPALWASYNSSGKYKHLVWIQESLADPKPGMLAFKGQPLGRDHQPSHVGLVTGSKTVIHSSSAMGCVVETDLLNGQWTLLAKHRLISVDESAQTETREEDANMNVLYTAKVVTASGNLNLRAGPSRNDKVIAKLEPGTVVEVAKELSSGWKFVSCDQGIGYVSGEFLQITASQEENTASLVSDSQLLTTTLMSAEGQSIVLLGSWHVADD